MDSNGCNFIALASSLAILISQEFETDDLNVLAAFFSALGDNIAIIAASR
ncbi:MAG: hypothetical protein IJE68_01520 [Clostridia bacterium]|nr:hypothetical protein [Clostridia bacterium]